MLEQKTTAFQPAKKTPVAPVPEVEAPQAEGVALITCLYCGAQSSEDRETCFACSCVLKK